MNKELDFLRGISPNDALRTAVAAAAAFAMMQRTEERRGEREGRPSIIYHAAIISRGPSCLIGRRETEREGGWGARAEMD